jgi:Anti-sigma-28 factor, FlgM
MSSGTSPRNEDRERLNRIREAIADGTYGINPHDVAVKLILSMLEFGDDLATLELGGCLLKFESDDDLSMFEGTDSSETEVELPRERQKKV